jgi:ferredoxin-like protein FixX
MRRDGTFIAVEVDDSVAQDAELARTLAEACPVDIFAQEDGRLEIVERNLDECVLCRLCLDAVAGRDPVPVKVIKLYDGEAVLA